jgi:AcrR family transcriptional regulator
MKEKIINKASDLFLTLGFKSVTMDDIANELGISKKTIYVHFPNKTRLVESTIMHMFETISYGINCICELKKNPIEEIYDIKNFVRDHLKNEKSSPQHQLQKYYPQIFESLKEKQFKLMNECVKENLSRGIELKLYRSNLNKDFIARIYFNNMIAIKNTDLFPLKHFSMNTLMENFLEYHVRGISTEKGNKVLNEVIKNSIKNQ